MSPISLLFLVIFISLNSTSEQTPIHKKKKLGPPKIFKTSFGADVKCITKATENSRKNNVINCYGIPYAKPPINELRFKYPESINSFQDVDPQIPQGGIWDATKRPNGCIQDTKGQRAFRQPDWDFDSPEYSGAKQSEDCLYLNIFRTNNDKVVPIMVWFHGGNFRWGYAASNIYDGSTLATHDVMVITVGYRLDIFGSLYIGGSNDIKGNQNYMDAKMALEWIQNNIGKFYGDTNRVTVFGESAGAQMALSLMGDKSTKGLFHRAISQSAPVGIPYRTPMTWAEHTDRFCENTGCYNIKITVNSIKDLQDSGKVFDMEKSDPDPHVEIIAYIKNPATGKEYSYVVGMTPWLSDTKNPIYIKDNTFPICQYISKLKFNVYDKHTKDVADSNKGEFLGSTGIITIPKRINDGHGKLSHKITRLSTVWKKKKTTGTLFYSYHFSETRIENCLRRLPSHSVGESSFTVPLELATNIKTALYNTMEPLGPTVDGKIITHQIYSLIRHNKLRQDVDLIMGVTEDEASLFVYMALPHPIKGGKWLQTWKLHIAERQMMNICTEQFNAYFSCGAYRKYCHPRLTYNCVAYGLMGEKVDILAGNTWSKLKQKMFGTKTEWDCPTHKEKKMLDEMNSNLGKHEKYRAGIEEMDCREKLDKIVESILFNIGVYLAGEKLKSNNVYLYQFDVAALFAHSSDAQSNPVYPVLARTSCVDQGSSCHGTELPFLWYAKLQHYKIKNPKFNQYSDEEKKLIKELQMLWTNFVKIGEPGKGWTKYSKDKKIFKFWYRKETDKGHDSDDEYKGIVMKMKDVEDFKSMKWWDDNLGDPWYIKYGHP